jgi:hypothetical protein
MFAPGFLIDQTLGTTAPEVRTVTMYGPAGEVETLTLPAQMDRYEELLTLGYSETQVETTTETSVRQNEDGGTTVVTQPEKQIEVADIKSEDLEKTAKGLSLLNTVATGLASTVGLPVAAFVNTQAVARYNDILDRMKSEGIDTDLERKGSIFGGEESLYAGLKDVDGSGGASFGDTWLGDLLGFDGEAGVQGAGLKDSFGGARRTSDTTSTSTKTQSAGSKAKERQAKNAQAGANLRSLGTNQGDAAARIQETAARTGQSIAEVGRSQAPSSASQNAAQRAAAEGDPRNMNTGGMVKRRKKK